MLLYIVFVKTLAFDVFLFVGDLDVRLPVRVAGGVYVLERVVLDLEGSIPMLVAKHPLGPTMPHSKQNTLH